MNAIWVLTIGTVVLGAYSTRNAAELESKKFRPVGDATPHIERVVIDRPA